MKVRESRPASFWPLAIFFALFVLFMYGPMFVIFILSFQGTEGGLTFPMRGVSLHWFAKLAEGLGVVSEPMPRAAAPLLSQTPGSQAGGTFYASVAWVNASGQEGEASTVSSFEVQDGHLLVVTAIKAPSPGPGFSDYCH